MGWLKVNVRAVVKDSPVEPYLVWCWKHLRGIDIPWDNVRNEIYDRQGFEIVRRVLDENASGIDIGCHKGEYLRRFIEVAPRGHHLAFEPIPAMAASLAERFSGVRVFQMALSDREGTAEFFHFPTNPALSGLARGGERTERLEAQRIDVRVAPLDAVIPQDTVIRLIKIDVEGAEGLVLAGASKLIARHRPFILFEHGKRASMRFGWSSGAVYDMLTGKFGLRVSRVGDWLTGRLPMTRREFEGTSDWYFLAHP